MTVVALCILSILISLMVALIPVLLLFVGLDMLNSIILRTVHNPELTRNEKALKLTAIVGVGTLASVAIGKIK